MDTPPVTIEPTELLLVLAASGFGTVLGVPRGTATGLRRVGRRDGPDLDVLLPQLYREQFDALVGYAARRLRDRGAAEDVVQRAFEKVWRRHPAPGELDNPAAYVATATRNEINRELRRVLTDSAHITTAPHPDAPAVPSDPASQVEQRLTLRDALAALATREREAVVLRLQWELSVDQTASVMGVSAGAVKGYTHHGLRKLRDGLAAG